MSAAAPNSAPDSQPDPLHDPELAAREWDRRQSLASGMLALPNLFLRSAFTMTLLYALVGAVLILLVEFEVTTPNIAVGIGVLFVLLQYAIGPWLMDLSLSWLYSMEWIEPRQLPDHLRELIERLCERDGITFPMFGLIRDGAPQAFTYGRMPGDARIVLSTGLIELLEPDELDAVIAHEFGHLRNWDMALMTLANLVPLLLYYVYRTATQIGRAGEGRTKGPAMAIGITAGLLYVVSEYLVLWFSRTREYAADRFAGQATGNPNALARSLVKIGYGLAAGVGRSEADAKNKSPAATGAMGALNIFDHRSSLNLALNAAPDSRARITSASNDPSDNLNSNSFNDATPPPLPPHDGSPATLDPGRVQSAMQWDLWNPWAKFYELNSTHPLVANRLAYLSDQAAVLGQEPQFTFTRKKPESYWDDFLVDLLVMIAPILGAILGVGIALAAPMFGATSAAWWSLPVIFAGLGSLLKTHFKYAGNLHPHLTVAALLGHIKVSPVRPVTATVTGEVIGKGVPGLIYCEDFVMRDQTGILLLDYQQPLGLWNFLFGLLKANDYQGKTVRVEGWFRRAPIPYFEIYRIETLDGSMPTRTCYTYLAARLVGWLMLFGGLFLAIRLGLGQ
ncbi:M48 family metalloprotease [Tuwongella immobilis]|uniref:Peptidase M48 domain-containing protein n=1 Tax=Tuwongella immobilis TaxID=692036 RepID=A0A6C2YJC3_9BACT|nr:M48 family metalloprotease [Tuwongella immobilis]VIP01205.1 peptidase m48 ste24p : Peptidase M48B family protein OS=Clostridium sp. CAG:524 GN=BN694_00708 PE=4 SV=1: Peptidase_M48 [Tuwongella immobilis]VTR97836.1 peptidase m48 ste24p : Peptidase M48B family protein OS=Clostridium sp. CAG:524 GN=BN694_00708 PE=4 SV=1: Peptidase_M48 [Tuwongella immobilis]